MSSALMRWGLEADTVMTSPPSASMSDAHSRSGSQMMMSSSVDNIKNTISSLAMKLLPAPGTPSTNEFGFISLDLSLRMRL